MSLCRPRCRLICRWNHSKRTAAADNEWQQRQQKVTQYNFRCGYDFVELFEPQPNNSIYMKSPLAKNVYGRLFGNIRHSRSSYIQNEFFLSRSFLKFDDDTEVTKSNGSAMETTPFFVGASGSGGGSSSAAHSKVEPAQYIFKGKLSRKMCGDWNAKLKLLRYTTQGTVLGIHFVSDYSHHFSGYKARITMESGKSHTQFVFTTHHRPPPHVTYRQNHHHQYDAINPSTSTHTSIDIAIVAFSVLTHCHHFASLAYFHNVIMHHS